MFGGNPKPWRGKRFCVKKIVPDLAASCCHDHNNISVCSPHQVSFEAILSNGLSSRKVLDDVSIRLQELSVDDDDDALYRI